MCPLILFKYTYHCFDKSPWGVRQQKSAIKIRWFYRLYQGGSYFSPWEWMFVNGHFLCLNLLFSWQFFTNKPSLTNKWRKRDFRGNFHCYARFWDSICIGSVTVPFIETRLLSFSFINWDFSLLYKNCLFVN